MWVFLLNGFFSIVTHNADPDRLLVRARVREDLERLRAKHGELKGRWVRHTPFADYPFRFEVSREDFAEIMRVEVMRARAVNFKSAIGKTEPARAATYSGVWGRLHELERLNVGPCRIDAETEEELGS